jgi:KaiC/GvpD/RAD55 family RecA-like ATPase
VGEWSVGEGAMSGQIDFVKCATYWATKMGIPVFPCKQRNKEPSCENGVDDATVNPDKIRNWGRTQPHANIGGAMGHSVFAVDVDYHPNEGINGYESLEILELKFGKIPDTLQILTPSGGKHYYFSARDFKPKNSTKKMAPGIDIKSVGGYVLLPPSIHPNGGKYNWDGASAGPHLEPIAAPPDWLVRLIRDADKPERKPPIAPSIPKGERNNVLFTEGCRLRGKGWQEVEILDSLLSLNKHRCEEPLPEHEIRQMAQNIAKQYPAGEQPRHDFKVFDILEGKKKIFAWRNPGEFLAAHPGGLQAFITPQPTTETVILSGWREIDQAVTIERQQMIVVAARNSVGKTCFTLQMALHIAEQQEIPVAYVSLEMSEKQIHQRLFSHAAQVNLTDIIRFELTDEEKYRILALEDRLRFIPLMVEDGIPANIEAIRTALQELKKKSEYRIAFIDHMGRIAAKGFSQYERVSQVARSIKEMARTLDIPVVAVCQLRRPADKAAVDAPRLEELRDSGVIEEEADIILGIHREDRYNIRDVSLKGKAQVELLKNRNGELKVFPMTFLGATQTFCSGAPETSPEPQPSRRRSRRVVNGQNQYQQYPD